MFEQFLLYAPLLTPAEMHFWDKTTQDQFAISEVLLMENACREVLQVLREKMCLSSHTQVLIFAGRGNNGGDGFALSKHLSNLGTQVLICHTAPLHEAEGAVREHIRMAQKAGVTFLCIAGSTDFILPMQWRSPDIIIDALCGIGLKGNLRNLELELVHNINSMRKHSFICSIDTPSGFSVLSGKPQPVAVQAHITVTFEAAKPGFYFYDAARYTGEIHIRNIGLPRQGQPASSWLLLQPQKSAFWKPDPLQHKGSAGKVLVIGGCEKYIGAPYLCARGALRTGAGLVHLSCPGGLIPSIRHDCPDLITHGIGTNLSWPEDAPFELSRLIREVNPDAIILGPGIGRSDIARKITHSLLALDPRPPIILDADALFFLYLPVGEKMTRKSDATISTQLLRQSDIITPHPLEFARLLPRSFLTDYNGFDNNEKAVQAVQNDRVGSLRSFTDHCLATVVLKGPCTLISQQTAPLILSPFIVPALAVGGSGDVLAGSIGALAGQKFSSIDAASLGVYLHAKAGVLLEERRIKGNLASEIADTIADVWKELGHVG